MAFKMFKMKNIHKYFVIVLVILQLIAKENNSQSWVYFTGTITDIGSGNTVPDYPVLVIIYDSVCLANIYTNQEGIYYDSVFIEPAGLDYVEVAVYDCNGILNSQYFQELDSINIADFTICVQNDDCFALFDFHPDFIDPFTFHFFNLSQGDFTSWNWDFGDGTSSSEFDPAHQYNSPGVYQVCLSIQDSAGICEDTYCGYITLNDSLCSADFEWQVDEEDPLTIQFNDMSIGEIAYWNWDFGDMTYSDEQSPDHQYEGSGQYLVTLTVFDSLETCFDMVSKWVYVSDSSTCVAEFKVELDTLNNQPNVYYFADISSGNINNWLWDFGDGQLSFEQNPSHTFQESGTYEVCLTISTNNGLGDCFSTSCELVTTPEYYNFGGHVFIGDYPLNVEEDDSSNMAVAYLYRRYENKWELMDSHNFWKFGYYVFTEKPEGEYIARIDLLPDSFEYGNYAPVYHNNATNWTSADVFILDNDEEFAININLKQLDEIQTGIGYIDGKVEAGLDCDQDLKFEGELIYLLNSVNKIISYTYTDNEGNFLFDGLGFGSYGIRAEITGKSTQSAYFQLDETNSSHSGLPLEVNCNAYVDIEEKIFDNDFFIKNIYPQPASDHISIDLQIDKSSIIKIEIIGIDGRRVWTSKLNAINGNQTIDLNIEAINSGLYILKISDVQNTAFSTGKIIIK